MSAEAPRQTGMSKEPQGCLPRFLWRFLGISEAQPKSTQTPIGFTALSESITKQDRQFREADGKIEAERLRKQREEDKKAREFNDYMAECARKRVQSGRDEYEQLRPLAESLRIRERLEYINARAWEGRGVVRDISTTPGLITEASTNLATWRATAGFELSFSYPSVVHEASEIGWRNTKGPKKSSVSIVVVNRKMLNSYAGPQENPFLKIHTTCSDFWSTIDYSFYQTAGRNFFDGEIPLDPQNPGVGEQRLDEVLAKETAIRIRVGAVPSKLILLGQEEIKQQKSELGWNKWIPYPPEPGNID